VKVGVTDVLITMLKVVVMAHCPAFGVNVYILVPEDVVLIVAGFQVPVIPFAEVPGRDGAVEFWHSGPTGLNVGVVVVVAIITAFNEAVEVHPAALVTVKFIVPGASPEIVLLVPVPVTPPGLMVQVPLAGKPVNTTLPVETVHVGWVMVPINGADGDPGAALMTALPDEAEVQPAALVTVKLYVPEERPVTVLLVPDPEMEPGLIVQLPDGNPERTTLPVDTVQVGWAIVPIVGADGAALTVRV
jgi:hypothetical protein